MSPRHSHKSASEHKQECCRTRGYQAQAPTGMTATVTGRASVSLALSRENINTLASRAGHSPARAAASTTSKSRVCGAAAGAEGCGGSGQVTALGEQSCCSHDLCCDAILLGRVDSGRLQREQRVLAKLCCSRKARNNRREPRAKQQLKPEAPKTKPTASRSVNKQGLSVTRDRAQLQWSSNAYILAARGEKGARHLPAAQPQAGLCEGSHGELCVDPTQSSATLRLLPPGEDAPTRNNVESCSHLAEGSQAVTLQPQGVPRAAHGTR